MNNQRGNPSIVTIGTVKTVKTFFFAFPALNSTAMNKKLKYSISYPITIDNDFQSTCTDNGTGSSFSSPRLD